MCRVAQAAALRWSSCLCVPSCFPYSIWKAQMRLCSSSLEGMWPRSCWLQSGSSLGSVRFCCSVYGSWTSSISIVRVLVGRAGALSHRGLQSWNLCVNKTSGWRVRTSQCVLDLKSWGRKGEAILDSLALSPGFPFCSDLYCGELPSGLPCAQWALLWGVGGRNQTSLMPFPWRIPGAVLPGDTALTSRISSWPAPPPGAVLVSWPCQLVGGLTSSTGCPALPSAG